MRILLVLALVLFLAVSALSAGCKQARAGAGGFEGPGDPGPITSVAKAKTARDDSKVVLVGHIVGRAGGDLDHYLFRDPTGEIVVDIDDKLFMGRTVTPQTRIRIYGEVDREIFEKIDIDVKRFEIVE